jgi:hypothetical protein
MHDARPRLELQRQVAHFEQRDALTYGEPMRRDVDNLVHVVTSSDADR